MIDSAKRRPRLERRVREWLREGAGDAAGDARSGVDAWVLGKMAQGEILDVGGIRVDSALLRARFACVPKRCSPAVPRGRFRSCCVDLGVTLGVAERGRLMRRRRLLGAYLAAREPEAAARGAIDTSFWLEEDGAALARPHGRCAFSRIEADGRLRCHLHGFGRAAKIPLESVQPQSCRLFPLALIALDRGKVLVTVLQASNCRLLGALPPGRFPCLADPALPPLLATMGPTLDALFGRGFARALRRRATWRPS